MSMSYFHAVKQLVWKKTCTSSSLFFVSVNMGGSGDTQTDSTDGVDVQTDNGLCPYNLLDR